MVGDGGHSQGRGLSDRRRFVDCVLSRCGCPYIYGANGPDAFDCSGLVVWALRQIGALVPDMSCSSIEAAFRRRRVSDPDIGCVVLYGKPATHCMVVVRVWGEIDRKKLYTLAGARGGGRDTSTIGRAFADGAMVDVVLSTYMQSSQSAIIDFFDKRGKLAI